jgi:hypothetical protein
VNGGGFANAVVVLASRVFDLARRAVGTLCSNQHLAFIAHRLQKVTIVAQTYTTKAEMQTICQASQASVKPQGTKPGKNVEPGSVVLER